MGGSKRGLSLRESFKARRLPRGQGRCGAASQTYKVDWRLSEARAGRCKKERDLMAEEDDEKTGSQKDGRSDCELWEV